MTNFNSESEPSRNIIQNLFLQGAFPSPKYMIAVGRLGTYDEEARQVMLHFNDTSCIPLTLDDPQTPLTFRKINSPDEDRGSLKDLGPESVKELLNLVMSEESSPNPIAATENAFYSDLRPLVIAGGTVYLHQDGSQTFQLNELVTASHQPGCYRWEQPYYWPGHLNQHLETRLAILFDTDSIIDVDDVSKHWRTHITAWAKVQGHRIETATLSRFSYAAASTALLNDNKQALDAAKASTKFQIRELTDKTGDDNIRLWLHAKDRDDRGRPMLIKAVSEEFDRQHIPLYEQIYDLSGLTQTFLVTRNQELLINIEKTLNAFDEFFKAPNGKGWYSHIDVSTKDPLEERLKENMGGINWNSVGDHVPAYLFSLLAALGPKHAEGNVRINNLRDRAEDMLMEAVKLIIHEFPGKDHPTVRERFTLGSDGQLHANLNYGWQQNRAIGGHNFKIIWNLTRAANYFNTQAERAEKQSLADDALKYRKLAQVAGHFADWLNDEMMALGIDPVNYLVHDGIERKPTIPSKLQVPWKPHGDFWQHEQGVNALGEQFGWHMRQGNLDKAKRILECWRKLNLVWTGKFLDFVQRSVHFRLNDHLERTAEHTQHIGGVDIAGYHESEYALLQNFMTKIYVTKEPLSLNFNLDADRMIEGSSNERLAVSGDASVPGLLRITQVTINGYNFNIPPDGNELVPDPEEPIVNLQQMGLDAAGNPKATSVTIRYQPKAWEDYWRERGITWRNEQHANPIVPNMPTEQMNQGIQLDDEGHPLCITFWEGIEPLVEDKELDSELLIELPLKGKKVVIVAGEDYIADEFKAYIERFQAYGADVRIAARMWGKETQAFTSDDSRNTQVIERLIVRKSIEDFSNFSLENVAIVVAPASNSMKNATYAQDEANPSKNEVTQFFLRALENSKVVVAANCHGLYAFTPAVNALDGYSVTANGDMVGEVRAAGATVVPDQIARKLGDAYVDRNLVTSLSGAHTNSLIDTAVMTYIEISKDN